MVVILEILELAARIRAVINDQDVLGEINE